MAYAFGPYFIETAKRHAGVFDDAGVYLLALYVNAARSYVQEICNHVWADGEEVPAPVVAAVLLVATDLLENREAASDVRLYANPIVDRLLWPYREFGTVA